MTRGKDPVYWPKSIMSAKAKSGVKIPPKVGQKDKKARPRVPVKGKGNASKTFVAPAIGGKINCVNCKCEVEITEFLARIIVARKGQGIKCHACNKITRQLQDEEDELKGIAFCDPDECPHGVACKLFTHFHRLPKPKTGAARRVAEAKKEGEGPKPKKPIRAQQCRLTVEACPDGKCHHHVCKKIKTEKAAGPIRSSSYREVYPSDDEEDVVGEVNLPNGNKVLISCGGPPVVQKEEKVDLVEGDEKKNVEEEKKTESDEKEQVEDNTTTEADAEEEDVDKVEGEVPQAAPVAEIEPVGPVCAREPVMPLIGRDEYNFLKLTQVVRCYLRQQYVPLVAAYITRAQPDPTQRGDYVTDVGVRRAALEYHAEMEPEGDADAILPDNVEEMFLEKPPAVEPAVAAQPEREVPELPANLDRDTARERERETLPGTQIAIGNRGLGVHTPLHLRHWNMTPFRKFLAPTSDPEWSLAGDSLRFRTKNVIIYHVQDVEDSRWRITQGMAKLATYLPFINEYSEMDIVPADAELGTMGNTTILESAAKRGIGFLSQRNVHTNHRLTERSRNRERHQFMEKFKFKTQRTVKIYIELYRMLNKLPGVKCINTLGISSGQANPTAITSFFSVCQQHTPGEIYAEENRTIYTQTIVYLYQQRLLEEWSARSAVPLVPVERPINGN